MNLANNRYLFYLVCIPVRLFIAYLTFYLDKQYLPVFGAFFAVIAASFIYLFIFVGETTNSIGQHAWWNNQRPIHALFYVIAAYLAFTKNQKYVWIPIVADAIFGLGNGLRKIL